jgi:hypothetical protein
VVYQIEVEVWNEGTFGTKHVGRGSVNIKSVLADRNQHVFFVVPLKHYKNDGKSKEGKEQGEVIIRGYLEGPKTATAAPAAAAAPAAEKAAPAAEKPAAAPAAAPAPQEPAPVAAQPAKPAPTAPSTAKPSPASAAVEYDTSKPLKLRIDQLQARDLKDKGGTWDKQDPALRITIGEFKPFDTER